VAYDPRRGHVIANTTRLVTLVELMTRDEYERIRRLPADQQGDYELGALTGAPFAMRRKTLLGPSRIPGNTPPWGTLAAVDINAGTIHWEIPFGDAPLWHPAGQQLREQGVRGLPNGGGPIVTAGGLVFIGASFDNQFRAFEVETGRQLWSAELPRCAIATPMTCRTREGKQIVVICAGGHGKAGVPTGDYVIAFALP
jgi:quinoprotein glucose dehydrogenase